MYILCACIHPPLVYTLYGQSFQSQSVQSVIYSLGAVLPCSVHAYANADTEAPPGALFEQCIHGPNAPLTLGHHCKGQSALFKSAHVMRLDCAYAMAKVAQSSLFGGRSGDFKGYIKIKALQYVPLSSGIRELCVLL